MKNKNRNKILSLTRLVLHRLKILRKSKFLRQEDLSKKLKIARSTYAKKELGIIPITTEEWLRLADVMDVEVDYFFSNLRVKVKDLPDSQRLSGFDV